MATVLEEQLGAIEEACKRYGVSHLHAFGSALREDFSPDGSDIDLLVQFQPMELHARADAYFGLLNELRSIFGRDVDLVVDGAVKNRYIARDIDRTKQRLYAA